jgi:peptidoglycan hydrolase-like protein with peptidoglycan-binding domain
MTSMILKQGCTGEYVESVQQRLVDLGYELAVTGTYDAETKAVVVQFQRDQDIYVDGRVGPETQASLENPK